MREAIDAVVKETGARRILSEAGPQLFGRMLEERVVDELFLTLAPQLAGRSDERRGIGLVDPLAFHPEKAPWADLFSVKRSDDYLLLRYAFRWEPVT
jgi:riboflavin biosynthesis pyrimidine reductase